MVMGIPGMREGRPLGRGAGTGAWSGVRSAQGVDKLIARLRATKRKLRALQPEPEGSRRWRDPHQLQVASGQQTHVEQPLADGSVCLDMNSLCALPDGQAGQWNGGDGGTGLTIQDDV